VKRDHEQIEEFLEGIVPPEYQSDEHRRHLREQVLARLQTGRRRRGPGRAWKTAVLLLGLLAAGAAATEIIIQLHHWYFAGRAKDGTYFFTTRPENAGTNDGPFDLTMINVGGDLDAAGIEQKRKDLEEVDALRQRNARELIGVADTAEKGHPRVRMFRFKYVLSDGRTRTNNETLLEADLQQIAGLRERGQREILKVQEVEFGGQRQRTLFCRYVLSDGRAVTRCETDPEQPGPVQLTLMQLAELARLALQEKGELLGSEQVQILGRTVTLQKYSFKLSDGPVVTRSEAQLDASQRDLSVDQWQELNRLAAAHAGETLGTYAEDVTGKPFKFTRARYVLSDGTEIIQSAGTPDRRR
jgi:hypothetical protein